MAGRGTGRDTRLKVEDIALEEETAAMKESPDGRQVDAVAPGPILLFSNERSSGKTTTFRNALVGLSVLARERGEEAIPPFQAVEFEKQARLTNDRIQQRAHVGWVQILESSERFGLKEMGRRAVGGAATSPWDPVLLRLETGWLLGDTAANGFLGILAAVAESGEPEAYIGRDGERLGVAVPITLDPHALVNGMRAAEATLLAGSKARAFVVEIDSAGPFDDLSDGTDYSRWREMMSEKYAGRISFRSVPWMPHAGWLQSRFLLDELLTAGADAVLPVCSDRIEARRIASATKQSALAALQALRPMLDWFVGHGQTVGQPGQ